MEQKIEFINEWRSGQFSIAELSRQFEISRPTVYKWIKRFEGGGIQDLEEMARCPCSHPNKTQTDIEEQIVSYSKKHPRWGGWKILKHLQKYFNEEEIPAISTIDRIIKRNGLVLPRKTL